MDATLLLCDHAAVADGKLYINGAGWTVVRAHAPASMGLAAVLRINWDETNIRHELAFQLMTEDGRPALNPEGSPWRAEGAIEVGRPPGIRHGTPMIAPMALVFPAVPLIPGRYRWELILSQGAGVLAVAEFDAVAAAT